MVALIKIHADQVCLDVVNVNVTHFRTMRSVLVQQYSPGMAGQFLAMRRFIPVTRTPSTEGYVPLIID
jgi:hypothetical protein